MILVDSNILLYAEDSLSPHHHAAREWWDGQLSAVAPVCLCWTVIGAFIRIATNRRIYEAPLPLKAAIARVQSWLDQPCTRLIYPTERHWSVYQDLLIEGQAIGNLVTDAHLAALALQHGCVLMSSDADFARFGKLRWKNPLLRDMPSKRK